MYVYIHICIYMHTHAMRLLACQHPSRAVDAYTCMHVYMYLYTYVYTCTHMPCAYWPLRIPLALACFRACVMHVCGL